jgi:protein SCO1/2
MNKRIVFVGVGAALIIALAAVLTALFSNPESFRGALYGEPYPIAPEIELTQADGEVFRLRDQRGKIVLLFFGYTFCPDVCPTTMADLKQALKKLGARADSVQVVFITVDPQRDTPENIERYVYQFNPSFVGLSGTEDELQPIWDGYGVFREISQGSAATNYLMTHTARVTLIDAEGNLRLSYAFKTPVEDIVHDLKILLK